MKLTEYGVWTYIRYDISDTDPEEIDDTEYVSGKMDLVSVFNGRSVKSGIIIENGKYHSHWGKPPILDLIMFDAPGASGSLAAAMSAPISRNLNYRNLASKMFTTQSLPPGALPVYKKDEE